MKKFLALLLALTMVMSLVACGGSGDKETTKAPAEGTGTTEAPTEEDLSDYLVKEPVTITFWHQYSAAARAEWIANVTKEFNETNEWGITVNAEYYGAYQAIADTIAACVADGGKGLPGLVTINVPRVVNFQNSGIVEPLDKYMKALGDYANLDDYLDAALDAVSVDGSLYGLPFGTSAGCIIYNKTVCDENNLPIPQGWEEFKTWCKNIYEKTGKVAFSFTNDFNYMNNFYMNCTGIDPAGDGRKSQLDNEAFKTFVKDVKALCDAGYCVMWSSTDDQLAALGAQTLVAYTNTTNNIVKAQAQAKDNGFEIDTMLGVTGTDKAPVSTISGAVLVSFAQLSQNEKAAAAAYMAYLTNAENNQKWVVDTQMLPSHYSTIQSEGLKDLYVKYPGYKNVFEQAENIISKNKTPNFQPAMEIFTEWVFSYVNGDISDSDFDSSWENMVEEVDEKLESAFE